MVKQEQLKHELRLVDGRCSDEVAHNRKLQGMLYQESKQLQKENEREKRQAHFGI